MSAEWLATQLEKAKVNPDLLQPKRETAPLVAQVTESKENETAEQKVRRLRREATDKLYMKNLHPIDLRTLQELSSFISEMKTKATEIKKSMENLDPKSQEAIDLQLQLKQIEFAIEKGRNEQVLVCGTVYKDLDRRNTFAYDACLRYETPFNFDEQPKSPTYNGTVKLETLNQTPTERSTIIKPV